LMTLVLWSHLLLENFANQRLPGAVIEDKINKPWRPIPSGRITPQETQELLRRAVPLVLLLDSVLGIFTQGLIAMLLIWLYNDLDGSGATPFERNLINAVGLAWYGWSGIIVLDGSESKLASTERHILPYRWLAIMTMAVITTVHAQDFPDIEGDRMRGRRTMPLVYGQRVSRCSLAVLILIWSLACPIFCNPSSMLMWALSIILGSIIATWTITKWDHWSNEMVWKLWCAWVCVLYALPAFAEMGIN
jgi:4-hydroxybenzoate polyprenyltransferase